MSTLKIRCPQTGRPIAVGIEVEPDALRHLPDVKSHVLCPECGQMHVWSKADTFLDPDDAGDGSAKPG